MIHLVLKVTPSSEKEESLTDLAREWREKILANLAATAQKIDCPFSAFNRGLKRRETLVYFEMPYGGGKIEILFNPVISVHVIFLGNLLLTPQSKFYTNLFEEFPGIVDWGVRREDL